MLACVFLERQNLPLVIGASRKGAQYYVSKMYENGTNTVNIGTFINHSLCPMYFYKIHQWSKIL